MAGRARFEAVVLTSGGVNCHGSSPLEHAPARPEAGRGGSSPIPRRAGSDRVRALGVKVPRLRELRRALPRLRRGAPRQQRAAPCRFSLCDLRLSVKQETDASLKCGGGTRCVRLVRGRGTRRVRLVRGGAAVGARGVAPADAPAPPRRHASPPAPPHVERRRLGAQSTRRKGGGGEEGYGRGTRMGNGREGGEGVREMRHLSPFPRYKPDAHHHPSPVQTGRASLPAPAMRVARHSLLACAGASPPPPLPTVPRHFALHASGLYGAGATSASGLYGRRRGGAGRPPLRPGRAARRSRGAAHARRAPAKRPAVRQK
jgi:hypothetical protein